jgi:hypothetical protein
MMLVSSARVAPRGQLVALQIELQDVDLLHAALRRPRVNRRERDPLGVIEFVHLAVVLHAPIRRGKHAAREQVLVDVDVDRPDAIAQRRAHRKNAPVLRRDR